MVALTFIHDLGDKKLQERYTRNAPVHQLLRYPNRPLGMRDPSRLHAGM